MVVVSSSETSVNIYQTIIVLHPRRQPLPHSLTSESWMSSTGRLPVYPSSHLEAVGLRVPSRYLRDFSSSISALYSKTVLLQDVHQLLMLSAGTLMYLKQILFPLVIFYNNCGIIHILDTNYILLYKFPDLAYCLLVFVCKFSSPFNQIDLIELNYYSKYIDVFSN
jgi:hypothetical protein